MSDSLADAQNDKAQTAFAATLTATMAADRRFAFEEKPVAAAPPSPVEMPSELPPRYELRRPLGEGGMGRVFEARDRQFGRVVAVKEALSDDPERERRFVLEALVTANLEHPGIPPVYERGTNAEGKPFYAMRMVRGRTLTEAMDMAKSLEERLKLLPSIIDVAQTLAYAHEQGVVHRDVKPDNIIVGRHGETVLLDWGIARVRSLPIELATDSRGGEEGGSPTTTAHGQIIGTPAYMAPEQAAGRVDEIDERTDVFAVGAILYHLLSGVPPYHAAKNLAQTIALAIGGSVTPLVEVAPDAPPRLVEIVGKAMDPSPASRFKSAAELADALSDAVTSAIRGNESRVVHVFADATSVLSAVLLLGLIVGIIWTGPDFAQLGYIFYFYGSLSILACVLALIEWRTLGRYSLSTFILALAACTLLVALGVTGSFLSFVGQKSIDLADEGSGAAWRRVISQGLFEGIVHLGVGASFAALPTMLWAIGRRRIERHNAALGKSHPAKSMSRSGRSAG